jgi:hypothetical protein
LGLGHLEVIRLLGLGHGPGPAGIAGRGSESEARSPQSLTARPFGLGLPRAGVKIQRWTQQIGKEKLGVGGRTGGSWGSHPSVPNGELYFTKP